VLVLLIAAGSFVYWRVEYALDRGLDTELNQATAVITPLVDASGQVTCLAAADATGAGWQVLGTSGQPLDFGGTAPAAPLVSPTDVDHVGSSPTTKDIGKFLPIADQPYRVPITALDPTGHYLVSPSARQTTRSPPTPTQPSSSGTCWPVDDSLNQRAPTNRPSTYYPPRRAPPSTRSVRPLPRRQGPTRSWSRTVHR
jgi:hypothetical protein